MEKFNLHVLWIHFKVWWMENSITSIKTVHLVHFSYSLDDHPDLQVLISCLPNVLNNHNAKPLSFWSIELQCIKRKKTKGLGSSVHHPQKQGKNGGKKKEKVSQELVLFVHCNDSSYFLSVLILDRTLTSTTKKKNSDKRGWFINSESWLQSIQQEFPLFIVYNFFSRLPVPLPKNGNNNNLVNLFLYWLITARN